MALRPLSASSACLEAQYVSRENFITLEEDSWFDFIGRRNYEAGCFHEECDLYQGALPTTEEARVSLESGEPTNITRVDGWGLMMCSAPGSFEIIRDVLDNGVWSRELCTTPDTLPLFWKVIEQEKVDVVVRLGNPEKEGYIDYLKEEPEWQEASSKEGGVKQGTARGQNFLVYERWEEHEAPAVDELYSLICQVDALKAEGAVLVHCKGGVGRSGAFAVCWRIYNVYKEAKVKGQHGLRVNRGALIQELRESRTDALKASETLYDLIKDFVDYLNQQTTATQTS